MREPSFIEDFFFKRISASGFGLMRCGWALTVLCFMIPQWADITRYYSDAGILPVEYSHLLNRYAYRFSLFDWITEPNVVFFLYLLLLLSSFFMLLGKWPRVTTIVSVLLLFSFHERNYMPLSNGDTVLRLVGFLLIIAPELRAFSVTRLRKQWHHWKEKGSLLPPLTMSIWPYRLLLWQLIVIYVTSAWIKIAGDTWLSGTAMETAFHHPHFVRWIPVIEYLIPLAPFVTYVMLMWEFSWALLLIPRTLVVRLIPAFSRFSLKRTILFLGVLFHGSIFLLMNAGMFSFAMFTSYLGVLLAKDFHAMRSWFNRKWHGKIAVLYDGNCGLCQHSVFILLIFDGLERLRLVNYHDTAAREKVAPDLAFEDLDRVLHMRFPDGSIRTGFYALRSICWNLPPLWLLAPLLYLPGVPPVGRRVYAWTAERRKRCTHEKCEF